MINWVEIFSKPADSVEVADYRHDPRGHVAKAVGIMIRDDSSLTASQLMEASRAFFSQKYISHEITDPHIRELGKGRRDGDPWLTVVKAWDQVINSRPEDN